MLVKPEIEKFAKIRVVGIGGAGCNVINTMIDSGQISGVEFIAVNTDAQALSISKAFVKIPIGQDLTHGLGAGSNPEIGRKAAEESLDILRGNLEESDMVFVTAGMGGGTGTGAAPVIASIAKELGALTVGVVTKPFVFEGAQRMANAERGIIELKSEVDALITIPNQKLLDIADDKMSILDAFRVSDSILNQGVQGISDLIVMPGLINVDFADVKTVMKDAGSALMGIGIGTGDARAEQAAKSAISSPLLEVSIEGATGILFNIIGGRDLTMKEVDIAARIIGQSASTDANIIFGTTIDDKMQDQIRITVIATGFDDATKTPYGIPREKRAAFIAPQSESQAAAQKPVDGKRIDTETPASEAPDGSKYDIPAFLRGK
ncbi:TPA: cell division protein FtsZ [candidate division WWE3 bacterium]|uniref:Cell division protein FtsZ n=4 Tax=Katanobacteria TaxID=422282 RepID=A0A0G1KIL3_UNCKA|nr:MAG: Cell division protein FtsZ [candidate division WWE3 bacterium GW2011_GWA2_44_16]KKT83551.1 MAG: Cell division protein FtsZ [candidate division WWE3 bacterium GW2011_GWC2_44_9]HAZ29871.1 cell division protein FtsZ [candidate division WWE3 bacterium]